MKIPQRRIPVFVSAPSPRNLSPSQADSTQIINKLLKQNKLEWRALGRSDYPTDTPLREVMGMVRHCSGGIILGFEQFVAPDGEFRSGSPNSKKEKDVAFPTPWNQLEAGILFCAGLPIMVFKEDRIQGGVFDAGSHGVYIHTMPTSAMSKRARGELEFVFQKWMKDVLAHYYDD